MKTFLSSVAAATVLLTAPVTAEPNHGAFLAATVASRAHDFDEAAFWYGVALRSDPTNPLLIDNALTNMIGSGDMIGAVAIASTVDEFGLSSQIANLVLDADAARRGDWDAVFAAHEAGREVSPLADGLLRAWAFVGNGNMGRAVMAFDEVIETPGMRPFGLYHKALALASAGDYEGAIAILTLPAPEGLQPTRRGMIMLSEALAQIGRENDAIQLIDDMFGETLDPTMADLRNRLERQGAVPFSIASSPTEGVAEIYFSIASVLGEETPNEYILLYARQAQLLKPGDADIALLIAELLEDLENYELAAAAYADVPQANPAFYDAELGRATVLRKSGDTELEVEVLRNLARAFPERPEAKIYLGNALRRESRFGEALEAYTAAGEVMTETDRRTWFVEYMAAVCNSELDNWPEAAAGFEAALARNPGHPQVLNYYGYSLVERGERLPEALDMIERAVAAEPENGNIVDSLGWALFVLGRVQEAVAPMERAVELSPMDAIINDHLGDVYWTVGRNLEARFQWNRALSLTEDAELSALIRAKLAGGLDAVEAHDEAAAALSTLSDL